MQFLSVTLSILFVGLFSGCAIFTPKTIEEECVQMWFGRNAVLEPTHSWYRVTKNNEFQGYLFRTDRVAPVVKGMKGEIGIWVGVDTQQVIRGVKPEISKETPVFFRHINQKFYQGFVGINPNKDKLPPVITAASISSGAIRKDIASATKTVFETMKQQ